MTDIPAYQRACHRAERALLLWADQQLDTSDPNARFVFQLVSNRAGIIAAVAAAAVLSEPRPTSRSGIPITRSKRP